MLPPPHSPNVNAGIWNKERPVEIGKSCLVLHGTPKERHAGYSAGLKPAGNSASRGSPFPTRCDGLLYIHEYYYR